ncbi:MAG: HXXEE domain-containing protein [Acidobacteriota bacterium]
MGEELGSFLRGTGGLSLLLAVSVVLTWVRPWRRKSSGDRSRLARWLLIGIAAQCFHSIEELLGEFYIRFPEFFGLVPWSIDLWVAFNIVWVALWILAALGLVAGWRLALLPTWFFALGMAANGIAHPLLAVASGGYFPGLVTSPLVGILGVWLLRLLWVATR